MKRWIEKFFARKPRGFYLLSQESLTRTAGFKAERDSGSWIHPGMTVRHKPSGRKFMVLRVVWNQDYFRVSGGFWEVECREGIDRTFMLRPCEIEPWEPES